MKLLVTGGTGFLGSRLIPKLIENGHSVLALARSPSSEPKLRALGATPFRGDLESSEPLALPPVDAVVHAAAHFRFSGPRAPYFQTNVEGTIVLLDAAPAFHTLRVCVLGTAAAMPAAVTGMAAV